MTGLGAAFIPARRAAAVYPLIALRMEEGDKGADSLRPHETFFSMATRSDSVVLISPLAHRRQH
jgi:hypothetical protein